MSASPDTTHNNENTRVQFLIETETTDLQQETEDECASYFLSIPNLPEHQLQHLREIGLVDGVDVCLLYENHAKYLVSALRAPLKSSFVSLDASRTWIMYWILHSLDLMGKLPANHVLEGCLNTLHACWSEGGFGGGPHQMAHAAPTYAAVSALCIIASLQNDEQYTIAATRALEFLQEIRTSLLQWFESLKNAGGGFAIHHDGEQDVRATYCVVSIASLLNILTPTLKEGAVDFLCKCQTYQGGFGGEPGNEAHGGYTYCAVAALEILASLEKCNMHSLRSWLVQRQTSFEGGFNGRSNKLVDGCYSFWQGGALAIVSKWFVGCSEMLCDEGMLQRYILLCAQDLNGGLRDKPSKPRDFYHSCYNLSGLSISQHYGKLQYGHAHKSRVAKTNACYNILQKRVNFIQEYFNNASVEVIEG